MTAAADSRVLADWYREETEYEITKTVPKAVEYGAGDLAEIGRAMGRIMGRANLSEQDATEIGVFFYLYGKMARWEQAIKEGRRASDDTLFDIRVYAGMARRNRQVGGWPWSSEDRVADEAPVNRVGPDGVHPIGFGHGAGVCNYCDPALYTGRQL